MIRMTTGVCSIIGRASRDMHGGSGTNLNGAVSYSRVPVSSRWTGRRLPCPVGDLAGPRGVPRTGCQSVADRAPRPGVAQHARSSH